MDKSLSGFFFFYPKILTLFKPDSILFKKEAPGADFRGAYINCI